jgi:hypothetical protein
MFNNACLTEQTVIHSHGHGISEYNILCMCYDRAFCCIIFTV